MLLKTEPENRKKTETEKKDLCYRFMGKFLCKIFCCKKTQKPGKRITRIIVLKFTQESVNELQLIRKKLIPVLFLKFRFFYTSSPLYTNQPNSSS